MEEWQDRWMSGITVIVVGHRRVKCIIWLNPLHHTPVRAGGSKSGRLWGVKICGSVGKNITRAKSKRHNAFLMILYSRSFAYLYET